MQEKKVPEGRRESQKNDRTGKQSFFWILPLTALVLMVSFVLPQVIGRTQDLLLAGKKEIRTTETVRFATDEDGLIHRLRMFDGWDEYSSIDLESGNVYQSAPEACSEALHQLNILHETGAELLPVYPEWGNPELYFNEFDAYAMLAVEPETGLPFVMWGCEMKSPDGTEISAVLDDATGKLLLLVIERGNGQQGSWRETIDPVQTGEAFGTYYGLHCAGEQWENEEEALFFWFTYTREMPDDENAGMPEGTNTGAETEEEPEMFVIRSICFENRFGFNVPEIDEIYENYLTENARI